MMTAEQIRELRRLWCHPFPVANHGRIISEDILDTLEAALRVVEAAKEALACSCIEECTSADSLVEAIKPFTEGSKKG